jgi:hypothetical protein
MIRPHPRLMRALTALALLATVIALAVVVRTA